ncbi:MAG: TMEM175 family protein [Frankiaceae bacterium]
MATTADVPDARVRPPGALRALSPGRLEAFSDGVFAIAITLLVIELHPPSSGEPLVATLEHEWPRYLGYLVSFAFIGGVWMAHSNMTRFLRFVDVPLLRLNLLLLLFVSLLPFTTATVATHLFVSYLATGNDVSTSQGAERVAVVLFGADLTLAALMIFLLIRRASRVRSIAVDDQAEEELKRFASDRRTAMLSQAGATVVGVFIPPLAVIFYLSVSVLFIISPFTVSRLHALRRRRPGT